MENLKILRQEFGLTQKQIASILNIKTNTYNQYEKGIREPKIEILKKLANYYNCSIDFVLGRNFVENEDKKTYNNYISALFSLKLKKLRIQNKITQEQLAKKLGVARTTITNYETGESKPDIETLKKIAEYFNCTIDDLLNTSLDNEPNLNINFVNKLKEYRKLNNYTQFDLAQKLNLKQTTISKWERDKSIPDIYIIHRIANIFNCSIDNLLGLEEHNNISKEKKECFDLIIQLNDYKAKIAKLFLTALTIKDKEE